MGNRFLNGVNNEAISVTIASGQTVSPVIDLGGGVLRYIQTGAGFAGTTLTFQASHDGVTFAAVLKEDGTTYTVTTAASRFTDFAALPLLGVQFIKLVAGTQQTTATTPIFVGVTAY